jgi:transposase
MNENVNDKEKQLIEELNKARNERETQCFNELTEILKKYNCDIYPSVDITINGEKVVVKLHSK